MNAQTRILTLLKKLNRGEIIDTKNDELWTNEKGGDSRLNDKTITRDFATIKEVFGEIEIKRLGEGKFQAVNIKFLADLLDEQKRNVLKIIYTMLTKNSHNFIKNIKNNAISQSLDDSLDVYRFVTEPIETELDKDIIKTLENSVRRRKKLAIDYLPTNGSSMISFKEVKPYKIY